MNKIYAILGPHTSGKTTVLNILSSEGIPCIIGYTTRKKLNSEMDGEEYHFVSRQEFFTLDLAEKSTYKGEYYGFTKDSLLKTMQTGSVCALQTNHSGFKQLKKLFNRRVESIYLMVDYVTMVERMLALRESNDLIQFHLEYAEKNHELETYKTTDHIVKNTGSIDTTINQVLAIMGLLKRP